MKSSQVVNLFLVGVSFTYLFAFASLYYQIPGLYGPNGILPVTSVAYHCEAKDTLSDCLWGNGKPTAVNWANYLGISHADMMEFLCLAGICLSAVTAIWSSLRDCFVYGILWFLYFSCFQVGQTFLWFQWDTLLLEVGLLTVAVAPWQFLRKLFRVGWLPADNVSLFLVRWLSFRLMFASGVVKLTSECPTWWGLTALHWHFESQCLPTWLAWYAHQSPDWFKKLSVAATLIIEILLPPLFLSPLTNVRKFCFFAQTLLMVTIVLSGNYNFFNFVTVVVCLPMIVESEERSKISCTRLKHWLGCRSYAVLKAVATGCTYGALAYYSMRLFGLNLMDDFTISSEITFTKADLYRNLTWSVPLLLRLGMICFAVEIVTAIARSFYDVSGKLKKLFALTQCFFMSIVCFMLFAISLVPISYLDDGAFQAIPKEIKSLHKSSDVFQITHSYGLFRHMTGVGGRPEIIIEGADVLNGTWRPYEFLYKPGSLRKPPPFNFPHQPRLDWQMWFAALDTFERNPWYISLVYKLLKGESDVLHLMGPQKQLLARGPKYIRGQLYRYHYTSAFQGDKGHSTTDYWWREHVKEYSPVFDLENQSLLDYIERSKFNPEAEKPSNYQLASFLRFIRESVASLTGHTFVWATAITTISLKFAVGLLPS